MALSKRAANVIKKVNEHWREYPAHWTRFIDVMYFMQSSGQLKLKDMGKKTLKEVLEYLKS